MVLINWKRQKIPSFAAHYTVVILDLTHLGSQHIQWNDPLMINAWKRNNITVGPQHGGLPKIGPLKCYLRGVSTKRGSNRSETTKQSQMALTCQEWKTNETELPEPIPHYNKLLYKNPQKENWKKNIPLLLRRKEINFLQLQQWKWTRFSAPRTSLPRWQE